MHKLTISLPDKAVELLRSLSAKKSCRVDEYVNELITNHLLEAAATTGHVRKGGLGQASWQRQGKGKMEPSLPFTVTGKYPGVSKVSLEWAQKFVNEAINLGGVRAFKNQDGVGFEPNFVFIERI